MLEIMDGVVYGVEVGLGSVSAGSFLMEWVLLKGQLKELFCPQSPILCGRHYRG